MNAERAETPSRHLSPFLEFFGIIPFTQSETNMFLLDGSLAKTGPAVKVTESGPGENRTPDLVLSRNTLYPTELRGHTPQFYPIRFDAQPYPNMWR